MTMPDNIGIQGNVAQQGAVQVNVAFPQGQTTEDSDRLCLRALRWPDSRLVKDRLKENKDKLLPKLIEWVLEDPRYKSWQDADKLCLLWIKGGAGKGKTMMSIGVIEKLLSFQDDYTLVTYFFCQNADCELNTLEEILKGLILQLVNQHEALKRCLRDHWDSTKNCFLEDVTSWQTLWNFLLEMLAKCNRQRVYIIIDALDECQDEGMADFLKLIVRNGLDQPKRIKWLLTSRPLDSAKRELLSGCEQVQVSLELNSKHVSEAVKTYIMEKTKELDRRAEYGEKLKQKIETELMMKAESTFLWVSLVCKQLESVHRDEALTMIQNMPPDLHALYDQILHQLSESKKAMRLLKVMMLAYRPLKLTEVGSVSGLTDYEGDSIEALVDHCASFIRIHENSIEFVHQSARDYLAAKNGRSILDSHEYYGHEEIVHKCLSHLSKCLKAKILGLPRPDSTRNSLTRGKVLSALPSVDYAATFWVQHLEDTISIHGHRTTESVVSTFLHERLLEWLECLILLDGRTLAMETLRQLNNAVKDNHSALMLVQDATWILLQHCWTLDKWPLQIYTSAIIFSPESSVVRRENAEKIPKWLRKIPRMKETWASLNQSPSGHSRPVTAIALSPNGRQIVSGSNDSTLKLWDTATGYLQTILTGHSDRVTTAVLSSDGRQIISGLGKGTIKLWDVETGRLQTILTGHSDRVTTAALSPDGRQIVSGFGNGIIKLWDVASGKLQTTLTGHSDLVTAVAFSPDGRQIASSSHDMTIKLWNIKRCLKASKYLGRPVGSRFKFRPGREIEVPRPITRIEFLALNQISTNNGYFCLRGILTDKQISYLDPLQDLYIREGWILYGRTPLIRLTSEFQLPLCYHAQGDILAIGLENGQVWSFDIDRRSLHSTLGYR